ncbi:hypothetical protein Hdeb2414_s0033g00723031 [Helianthus debilis subsp. tardiflorus]
MFFRCFGHFVFRFVFWPMAFLWPISNFCQFSFQILCPLRIILGVWGRSTRVFTKSTCFALRYRNTRYIKDLPRGKAVILYILRDSQHVKVQGINLEENTRKLVKKLFRWNAPFIIFYFLAFV